MPQQGDNMDKRRAKREAMRAKQAAQHRKMKRMLILASVILVLCGAGLYYLVSGADTSSMGEATVKPPKETEAPKETMKPAAMAFEDPITTIHIKAAGDLNITNSVIDAGLAISGYDFSYAFQDVAAAATS